ncbi:MAG: SLC13/DASS family transporter [Ignavibacteriaceae bacterium]|nr:SLC13/DASS family transporter [Ignavibacteriaceae bacterium]
MPDTISKILAGTAFKRSGLIAGVLAAILFYIFADFGKEYRQAEIVAAVALLMSVWWITEAVPLAVTSLVPLVIFPLTAVSPMKEVSQSYINSTIFLFLGGFLIALAMERWNLHKRIALSLVTVFGTRYERIVLGFMAASGFISMWISNTATAVMLLPIGLAVIRKISEVTSKEYSDNISKSLLLGIAYACSIGGVATIVGTPPNLVYYRVFQSTFPAIKTFSFGEWIVEFLPFSIGLLLVVWFILTKVLFRDKIGTQIDPEIIKTEKSKLGVMVYEEKMVLFLFVSTALLWIFREELKLGFMTVPGWAGLFPKTGFIDDGTVAIFISLILFLIPAKNKTGNLLDNTVIKSVPWDIILLFGGGFALADAFISSKLSGFIGSSFTAFKDTPPFIIILSVALIVTFMTELTSNTATAQILLPLLASLSVEWGINPQMLMLTATISASMAFMMPVATPPNAIVFSAGKLKISDMAKTGLIINFIAALAVSVMLYLKFG